VLLPDIAVAILDAAAEDEAVIFRRIGVGTAAFGGGAAECRIDIGTVVDAERDQRRAGKVERAP
jgi:hypothetical protein